MSTHRRYLAAVSVVCTFLANPAAAAIVDFYAGGGAGDGLPAIAQGIHPVGIAADLAGDVLVADIAHNRVRRVDLATGLISTVAGRGWLVGYDGYAAVTDCGPGNGDGGAATAACIF